MQTTYPHNNPYFSQTSKQQIKPMKDVIPNSQIHLQAKIMSLQEELKHLSQMLGQQHKNGVIVEQLSQRLKQQQQLNKRLSDQLQLSQKNNEQLKQQLNRMGKQFEIIYRQIQQTKQSKSSGRSSKRDLQDDITKLNNQIEEMLNKMNRMHHLNEEEQKNKEELLKQLNQKTKQLETLQQNIKQLIEENNYLKQEINSISDISIKEQNKLLKEIQQIKNQQFLSNKIYNGNSKQMEISIYQQEIKKLKTNHEKEKNSYIAQINLARVQLSELKIQMEKKNIVNTEGIKTQGIKTQGIQTQGNDRLYNKAIAFSFGYGENNKHNLDDLHMRVHELNQDVDKLKKQLQQNRVLSIKKVKILEQENQKLRDELKYYKNSLQKKIQHEERILSSRRNDFTNYQLIKNHTFQENDQRQTFSLKEQVNMLQKRLDKANRDVTKLKECVDQAIFQNKLTPRQPTCAVQRAISLISILSQTLYNTREALETLKKEKKQLINQKDRLILIQQTLQHQKNQLLDKLNSEYFKEDNKQSSYRDYNIDNQNRKYQPLFNKSKYVNLQISKQKILRDGSQNNPYQKQIRRHKLQKGQILKDNIGQQAMRIIQQRKYLLQKMKQDINELNN